MKTSSPIEENKVVEGVEELDNEKDQVVSPILFACEDEGEEEEERKTEPLLTQKPQCNGHITDEYVIINALQTGNKLFEINSWNDDFCLSGVLFV